VAGRDGAARPTLPTLNVEEPAMVRIMRAQPIFPQVARKVATDRIAVDGVIEQDQCMAFPWVLTSGQGDVQVLGARLLHGGHARDAVDPVNLVDAP
jgi:hypothetical protein